MQNDLGTHHQILGWQPFFRFHPFAPEVIVSWTSRAFAMSVAAGENPAGG
jgi:hypothetical protein